MTETHARTGPEAISWIIQNPHHEGYIRNLKNGSSALVLVGDGQSLVIPKGMTVDLIRPSNFEKTGRMFEPTKEGWFELAKSRLAPDGY
ncbi:hypothetical protein [Castellaniella sp.]|uniref:hypothetical protein n=1 Tax=Castellaniella sp. TaxID=1955812 RepID=UPI002AFEDBEC|nr:hypothetical protein [Castellaniella sp.]